MFFEISRREYRPGRNAIAKAGSKSLNLPLDGCGHISGITVRNMTISPGSVLALWRAGGVEETRLRQQHKRTARGFACPVGTFGFADLRQRSSQMDCPGFLAF